MKYIVNISIIRITAFRDYRPSLAQRVVPRVLAGHGAQLERR